MGVPTLDRVKRSSLATEVAKSIHQSIAKGDLPPGTRLIETNLANQLGVSRGPLREALRILESEGIVESIPGRGTYVKLLSESDIIEVYSLRTILEQEAVRLAAQRATDTQIIDLEMTLKGMMKAANEHNLSQVINLDLDFHFKIWEAANHKLLLQVLKSIASQIKIYLAVQTSLYEDLATGITDHRVILECIKIHDGDESANLMEKHLTHATRVVTNFAHKQEKVSFEN